MTLKRFPAWMKKPEDWPDDELWSLEPDHDGYEEPNSYTDY